MNTEPLQVFTYTLCHTMEYRDSPVLAYEINYPQFKSCGEDDLSYLNMYYEEKSFLFKEFARKNLFPLSVEQHDYSMENQYPPMTYEVRQDYTVTYNEFPLLSLYYDQYQFTGGAHGSTVRYSNVWNLEKKSILQLKDFYPDNPNYREDIIASIEAYIAAEQQKGDSAYFDDYKTNVAKEFNENNFYITPEGIVVYFQQYEIAPYSSGILQFLIPYVK